MRMLTIKEATKEYRICRNTLYNIINKHPNCCYRIGRSVRIDADVLDDIFRTNEEYHYKPNWEVKNG
jgi:hypothetical protein